MSKIEQVANIIDSINNHIGKVLRFLIIPLIGIILYEVVMRYFLLKSQLWVPEISLFIFATLFLIGSGYSFNGHVRLDILYNRLSEKSRAILDMVTSVFFFLFCIVLLCDGSLNAWDSLMKFERSSSAFGPVLFPIKFAIPIGALLFLLQGISKLIRDILILKGTPVEH
jgi:TRAP-type mannitol/chloroaromatic compound transport system permease small subunit